VALDLLKERGVPLDRQTFTWKELAPPPYSKLNADAMSRVRVILMNGIESEAIRFSHACARMNRDLQLALAKVRRVEQHQQTLINWLHPADQTPLETTLAFEQVAIEVTAHVALHEPNPYLAQVYRFGMLEDFDHLYRFSALYDRLDGKDSNTILQSYTDVVAGRPTVIEHRAPEDELRRSYERMKAAPITKLNALTIVAGEHQTHDYYMTIGPMFSDPVARQLYAEIASIEEQHVTQYESLCDATETWLEKWLLHEATEVYNYYSCMETETDPRLREIWTRMLDYELGQLRVVRDLLERFEHRDVEELLPSKLPEPVLYESHRRFVQKVLADEVDLRAVGTEFMDKAQVPRNNLSIKYQGQVNREGSPSEIVAKGYVWTPGTELARLGVKAVNGRQPKGRA
jgi:rubrerythrin